MRSIADTGASSKYHLIDHELSAVLTDGTRGRAEAGIGLIAARCPLPDIAVKLLNVVRFRVSWLGVQASRTQQVADYREVLCRELPFRLAGQSCTCPAGERLGLVIAEVTGGLGSYQALFTGEGILTPVTVYTPPVKGALPVFALNCIPAICQPEISALIAAIGNEVEEFTVADRSSGQRKRFEETAMARSFIVEVKITIPRPNCNQPSLVFPPIQARVSGSWVFRPARISIGRE